MPELRDAVPLTRIVSPSTMVRRLRRIEGMGEIRVAEGARVEPGTLLAEQEAPGALVVLDAARTLGAAPGTLPGLLLVPVGERVAEGQPLARKRGLLARTLVCPLDGTLLSASADGLLLIRGNPQTRPVFAMMHGEVLRVLPGEGMEIEGHGALVQGVWGNGQESTGLLRLIVSRADEPAPATRIDAGVQGTILVAGATLDAAALENARLAEVRGLVAGSMEAALVPLAQSLPFPVLLTEGFGSYPFCPPVFEVLQTLNNREATLSARFQPPTVRPELLVPLPGAGRPPAAPGPLGIGDRVRLLGEPYLGRIGTVDGGTSLAAMPNDLLAPASAVRLDTGERISIPLTNLERLLF